MANKFELIPDSEGKDPKEEAKKHLEFLKQALKSAEEDGGADEKDLVELSKQIEEAEKGAYK